MNKSVKEIKYKLPSVNTGEIKEKTLEYKNIIIAVIAVCIISAIGAFCKVINSSSINMNSYFSSASKGYNPDGSPYNIAEILSTPVLEMAVEKLDGKTDVDSLKRHMSVSDITKKEDMEKVKSSIKDGNTEYTDVPTMYILTYSIVSDRIKDEGFLSGCKAVFEKMISPKKKDILNAVAQSYCEFYTERYINESKSLELDWSKADSLDYYNKAGKTEAYARKLSRFVTDKYNKNTTFVSEKDNVSYGDLQTKLSHIISVDIENYKSFVIQNGITEDKPQLLRQLRYMDEIYNEISRRETAKYNIIKDAIGIYDANVTKVVFIPSLDYNNSFYMNRTKVGIDYLVEDANTAKTSADEAFHNSESCTYLMNQFGASADASDDVKKTADEMYSRIKEQITGIAEETAVLIEEELGTKKSEKVEIGEAYISTGFVSMAVSGAKTFIAICLVLFLLSSLYGFMKKKNIFKI